MRHPAEINILMVDDNPDALLALATALQPLGARVLTATMADEGLRLARENELAVALVDIRMPRTDGFAMVERLRADPAMRTLPVIFVSAVDPTPEVRERVYALGAADFVAVPVQPGELRSKVSVFVELHRQKKELEARARAADLETARVAREQQDRFESLADSMAQMAWIAEPSGARVWFNRRWLEYTGTTLDELHGWGFGGVYHPDERERILADIRQNSAAGVEWHEPWRIRGRDGRYRWFLVQAAPVRDSQGKVIRWFGTNTDIDEHVLIQQQLKASEQKFREIFETANEGIWIVDAEARVELVNARMGEILGYARDEIVGRRKTEFIFPEDLEFVRGLFAERRRGAAGVAEVRFRRKDGAPVWTLLSARPLFREGTFAGALDMYTDISARKQAARQFEEDLKAQVAQRTSALEEKSRQLESFAYTIAHDLRSPLRAISGYAEFTLEDFQAQLPPEAITNLKKIQASAARLDELIRDLLSYARVSQVEFVEQDVPLEWSVQWALEQLRTEIQGRDARVQVAPELPAVRGERNIIDQLVLNLLSNAVKFVAPGVTPRIAVTTEVNDSTVRLKVSDNGIGIPKEYHQRIFRVFERLQGPHRVSGTGVGLAIVARAAERLGGRAGVESDPGRGSTFWIEFKRSTA